MIIRRLVVAFPDSSKDVAVRRRGKARYHSEQKDKVVQMQGVRRGVVKGLGTNPARNTGVCCQRINRHPSLGIDNECKAKADKDFRTFRWFVQGRLSQGGLFVSMHFLPTHRISRTLRMH